MEAPERVTFWAVLASGKTAISYSGMGDGCTIKLELPSSEAGAGLLLAQWATNRALRVTVEPDYSGDGKPPA